MIMSYDHILEYVTLIKSLLEKYHVPINYFNFEKKTINNHKSEKQRNLYNV